MCVHGEIVIASQMQWHQFEVTKQSHKAHQKWSFQLVSGQMTLQMHHSTQENAWFGDDVVVCVHDELVIAIKMRWHQFEDTKRATETAHPKRASQQEQNQAGTKVSKQTS